MQLVHEILGINRKTLNGFESKIINDRRYLRDEAIFVQGYTTTNFFKVFILSFLYTYG